MEDGNDVIQYAPPTRPLPSFSLLSLSLSLSHSLSLTLSHTLAFYAGVLQQVS
jgi:hypothetical protein